MKNVSNNLSTTHTGTPTLWALHDALAQRGGHAQSMDVRLPPLLAPLLPTPFPVVSVTGTNGKGSVCAMSAAAVAADGRRVGLFTSPHLVSVCERLQIDGRPITETRLEALAADMMPRIMTLPPEARPTFFEVLLLAGLTWFREEGVALAVLEVGIGGRNDAVRHVPAVLSVITSVGLDHAAQLGNTLGEVAAHKADLCAPGGVLVIAPHLPSEALEVAAARSRARGIRLVTASAPLARRPGDGGWTAEVQFADGAVHLPLPGAHQADNLAVVRAIVHELAAMGHVRDVGCLAGVARTVWPGRLQRSRRIPRLILDVAHNPQGLAALAQALDDLGIPFPRRTLIYGVSAEKDMPACAALLPRLAPRMRLVGGFYRACTPDVLRAALPDGTVVAVDADPAAALAAVAAEGEGDGNTWYILTGSVFLVGAALGLGV